MHITRSLSLTTVATALLLMGCGDDDDSDADAAYCDIAAELAANGETAPTRDQLDRIRAAAPSEIDDEVDTAAGILEDNLDELASGDASVFEDAELRAAIEVIQAYDAEHCGLESTD